MNELKKNRDGHSAMCHSIFRYSDIAFTCLIKMSNNKEHTGLYVDKPAFE